MPYCDYCKGERNHGLWNCPHKMQEEAADRRHDDRMRAEQDRADLERRRAHVIAAGLDEQRRVIAEGQARQEAMLAAQVAEAQRQSMMIHAQYQDHAARQQRYDEAARRLHNYELYLHSLDRRMDADPIATYLDFQLFRAEAATLTPDALAPEQRAAFTGFTLLLDTASTNVVRGFTPEVAEKLTTWVQCLRARRMLEEQAAVLAGAAGAAGAPVVLRCRADATAAAVAIDEELSRWRRSRPEGSPAVHALVGRAQAAGMMSRDVVTDPASAQRRASDAWATLQRDAPDGNHIRRPTADQLVVASFGIFVACSIGSCVLFGRGATSTSQAGGVLFLVGIATSAAVFFWGVAVRFRERGVLKEVAKIASFDGIVVTRIASLESLSSALHRAEHALGELESFDADSARGGRLSALKAWRPDLEHRMYAEATGGLGRSTSAS